ncbi:PAS domain-containing sensor histidine kinase [Hymenobacter weizhouensis]|uniref:PAS domain-containing sensor histidine kinase n=1 Tax=Hymenobacter sp. YIM 151500-1 TaxID=2987689 RepID=UPI0022262242|nr:ATP-binding protein [Hymenobacter sp. YIM 151500-1]UYZ62030.1 ATP-binding protein [Hymenobacter sp. YIM 151500-1]
MTSSLDLPEFYPQVLENLRQVFFVYDPAQQRVETVNAAYEQVMRRPRAQLNDELPHLVALLHPNDRAYAARCWQLWNAGRLNEQFELRLLHPDGAEQWLCVDPYHTVDARGQVLLSGLITDITASKEYINNANKFNAKKNATLEILSHDLAGPFAMLQQLAGYIEERVEPLHDETLIELLRVMHDTCRDSVNLIRDFVDNEFLESANVELKLERYDLVERLRLMMEEYKRSEEQLAKRFHYEASHPVIYAEVDENKFMQVMNNLLSNAIKFTREGGNIWVRVAQEPGYVLVSVTDDGVGIPQGMQPVLFERFTKARRPGLRGEKSTGLGMSIIKTIVELHQGTIQVQSVENQGSTFTIRLPDQLKS